MNTIDDLALQAAKDEKVFEELLIRNKGFIIKCAYEVTKKFISEHDDEWSVSIIAFSDAVKTYEQEKGSFYAYSKLLITRKLIDYYRSEKKYNNEISVDPSVYDIEPEEDDENLQIKSQLSEKLAVSRDESLKYEISAANEEFAKFGFSFYSLAESSPKSSKTKKACALVVNYILDNPEIFNEMNEKKQIPIKKILMHIQVPRKILERHRMYIIAATKLLSDDYPYLAEYVSYIRNERR